MRHAGFRKLRGLLVIVALLPHETAAQSPSEDPRAAVTELQQQLAARSKAASEDTALSPAERQSEQSVLQQVDAQLQSAISDLDETARLVEQRLAAPAILARLASGVSLAPAVELPSGWSDGTQAQLEAVMAEVDAATQAASQRVSQLQAQASEQASSAPLLGADLAAARQSLSSVQGSIEQARSAAGKADSDGPADAGLVAQARAQALMARIALIEEQRDGADLRGQLLAAEIADAERQVEALNAELAGVREVVARRRLSDAIDESARWQASSVGHLPEIGQLAQANRDLADLYVGPSAITHRIDEAQAGLSALEKTIAGFKADTQVLRGRLIALGRSVAAGVLIRESLRSLPSLASYDAEIESRSSLISETQVRIVELTSQRQRLERNFAGVTDQLVAAIPGLGETDRTEARGVIGSLLESRSRILAPLIRDLERYVGVLTEYQDQERVFVDGVQQVRERLRGQEPWVRNARVVSRVDVEQALGGMRALVAPAFWAEGARSTGAAIQDQPWKFIALALAILFGVAMMITLHRRRMAGVTGAAASQGSYKGCVGGALLNGLALMGILATLGWGLASIKGAPPGIHVLGLSLLEACLGGFGVALVAALFARRGGIAHFRPDLAPIAARGREAVWLLSSTLLLGVASRMLFAAHSDGAAAHADLAARLCLMTSALVIAVMFHRVVFLKLRQAASRNRGTRGAWIAGYVATMLVPVVFLWLIVQGFLVGALDLIRSLLGTLLVVATAAAVHALVAPATGEGAATSSAGDAVRRHGRDRLWSVFLLMIAAALLMWIWREVIVAFDYLQNVVLWSTETASGITTVTVANLLACVATLAGTLLAFWVLPLLTGTQSLDTVARGVGTRYAVVTLLRYMVLLVGVIVAFTFLNIGWSKIQWLATGLSVGLGFGLQEIVANFFSGLILLSERSIRVGDMVAVGDQTGVVTRIHVRATTVRDYDGREILIPNKEMVAAQVTNWTLSNTQRRVQVVVGVAYGSDTALVERLLLEAAAQTPGVLAEPAPSVAFELFADSSLQFRLYCWIAAADRAVATNHLLHVRIEQVLRLNGISIPFPQRDLHLDMPVPMETRTADGK